MVVLVTGGNGQLGQALQSICRRYPELRFVFLNSSELDITSEISLETAFAKFNPDYCINTAAYTAVDKAESEPMQAALINMIGAGRLAERCLQSGTTLLHISTDFVFDGTKSAPYTELDTPNPISVYGRTKHDGEKIVAATLSNHYIVRTSWVYSSFENNFYKTMLRLGRERNELAVVNDQVGTPTHAIELASVLIKIIEDDVSKEGRELYGIYHFSNEGQCSWYEFAKSIFEIHGIDISLKGISSTEYPTPAKRPPYSVLDKSKIVETFGIEIPHWEASLRQHFIVPKV